MALTVSTQALGRRKPLLADFGVPPPQVDPGAGDALRLRHVIEHVVRRQLQAFAERQEQERFDRVLAPAQIEDAARRGKVNPAARERTQQVDPDQAVGAALQGFEDGLYLVIIDGVERKALDEIVQLSSDSRLVFIRLTFLAGA
ncbi:MAG: hypothetical protein ACF8R7_16370 [Phycisphaerales bacterium JB039]